jgi:hypothetical protein
MNNKTDKTRCSRERGSVLVMAMFVLLLLTSMGMSLLFLSENEIKMSLASANEKKVFYLAEAGQEDGRASLFNTNGADDFSDDLADGLGGGAAGPNGVIDFDPDNIQVVHDSNGNVTGFTGYGDDIPLRSITALGDGFYAAFLTNDAGDPGGIASTSDTNDRVMITGVGAGEDGAMEVIQAIVEPAPPFPGEIPATITMFGSNPSFSDVDAAAKVFRGDDCSGAGIPGFSVPVAGLIGTPAESVVESSLNANTTYTSGGNTGDVTVADLTDPTDPGIVASSVGLIDPAWADCEMMRGMTAEVRGVAGVVCTEGVPCALPPSAPGRVVFSDGDFTVDSSMSGDGMLWVTGTLTMSGAVNWNGLIVVVGEGVFVRSGAGAGRLSGATIVADIAGADNVYGTSDDCTGGTDGLNPAVYDESLGGTGETVYCTADILAATPITKYTVAEFRQR